MIRMAMIAIAFTLGACISLPPHPEKPVTTAMLDTAQTRLQGLLRIPPIEEQL